MSIPKKQVLWDESVQKATDAIQALIDVQEECQEKLDAMSEKAQEGESGQKLDCICDLDLQGAMDTLSDASTCEIP